MSEAQTIITRLRTIRLPVGNELDMQDCVGLALLDLGVDCQREHSFGPADRVDFFTASGLAIELKIDGTRNAVLRQLMRYADHDSVKSLLLITACARHLGMPPTIRNKPLTTYQALSL